MNFLNGLVRDILKVLPGVLAAMFIGVVATLFLVFPRVVNELANLLGNMGDPLNAGDVIVHWAITLLIWAVIGYFFVYRPLNRFRLARSTRGLLVRRGKGIGFIDTESVRQQIYAAVARISEVQGMEVSVINELGKAEIHLNILSGNRINGAQKKTEIRREVKRVVEDQLGVSLSDEPVINIKLVPIFEDLSFAAPVDATYASAYSGLQRLPAPVVPANSPNTSTAATPAVVGKDMIDAPVVENPRQNTPPAPTKPAERKVERSIEVEVPPTPAANPVTARRPFAVDITPPTANTAHESDKVESDAPKGEVTAPSGPNHEEAPK